MMTMSIIEDPHINLVVSCPPAFLYYYYVVKLCSAFCVGSIKGSYEDILASICSVRTL